MRARKRLANSRCLRLRVLTKSGKTSNAQRRIKEKQRVRGIEPPCAAWEAAVLPLNYTRMRIFDFRLTIVIGSLKQFKSSLVGECRFAIHSTRCARSGQVLETAKSHCHEITSSA